MAGRQVTAIISQTGEPIRNIPWPLYYKPCQYNYPQWGEQSQRGGSCDPTPATPESLLTDSVDTPTEFYPRSGHNRYGARHSRGSPELLTFSVSDLLHQEKPGHATPDYEPALSPPGYVFGNNRVDSTQGYVFGSSSWRPPDNRTPYHAGRDKGEIPLFEKLPLSVKTKGNPILNSKDKLFFKVSGDQRTETCNSAGWPFLATAVHPTCHSSIEWSESSSLKDTLQSPTSAELALLISPDDLTSQPTTLDDNPLEDTSKTSSVSESLSLTVRLDPSQRPVCGTGEDTELLSITGPSELALSVSLSDCGRALSVPDSAIPGNSPNILSYLSNQKNCK